MPKPYDVIDVCHLVIKICNEDKYIISNLKLHKVLYFIQAYFLTKVGDGTPCFRQQIEAWQCGPVVWDAYVEYKKFGSASIPLMEFRYETIPGTSIKIRKIPYDENVISPEDAVHIKEVVRTLGNYSSFDLVKFTHVDGGPWKNAYEPDCKNVISIKSIWEYFKDK